MAEIKINLFNLEAQLLELKTAANGMESNPQLSEEGVNTLITSMKYIEQHKQIGELFELYKKLIAKDMGDIRSVQYDISQLDTMLSQLFGKK